MCAHFKECQTGISTYDATRYAWKVSEESISDVDLVLGIDEGKVVGVFQPNTWLPGDHPHFRSLDDFNEQYSDRFGFFGKETSKKITTLYLNKTIQEMKGTQGGLNPVRFFESTNRNTKKATIPTSPSETGSPKIYYH